MAVDSPHFWVGHMCTGCPFSGDLHTGCIVEGTVRVVKEVKIKEQKPPVEKLDIEFLDES